MIEGHQVKPSLLTVVVQQPCNRCTPDVQQPYNSHTAAIQQPYSSRTEPQPPSTDWNASHERLLTFLASWSLKTIMEVLRKAGITCRMSSIDMKVGLLPMGKTFSTSMLLVMPRSLGAAGH